MSEWVGDERRGIPIHVLNYVDTRLEAHVTRVEQIMSDHVGEEMERYKEILDLINRNNRNSEERHHTLIQSITAYMGKQELIETAFLKTAEGYPDYAGHKNYHQVRKSLSEWWKDKGDKVITKLFELASMGLLIWIGTVIWEAFLKGPKQ